MDLYSCCFTGHREVPEEEYSCLRANLLRRIVNLVEDYQVKFFYNGAARGFDTMAAEAVLLLKQSRYPSIRLILGLPCRNQAARWPEEDKALHREICQQADQILVLSEHYFNGCMQQRNRFLVDHSNYCVCYQTHPGGGTGYTVNYAKKQGAVLLPVSGKQEEWFPQQMRLL